MFPKGKKLQRPHLNWREVELQQTWQQLLCDNLHIHLPQLHHPFSAWILFYWLLDCFAHKSDSITPTSKKRGPTLGAGTPAINSRPTTVVVNLRRLMSD